MSHRALVIESNHEILSSIEEVLDSLGHQFDVVSNLADALKQFATNRYSYILSNVEIQAKPRQGQPNFQNIEILLERLTEMSNGRCPRIIVITDLTAPINALLIRIVRLSWKLFTKGLHEFIGNSLFSEDLALASVIKDMLRQPLAQAPSRGIFSGSEVSGLTRDYFIKADEKPCPPTDIRGQTFIARKEEADDGNKASQQQDAKQWVTVTAAARLLMQDISGLNEHRALSRVSTAASRNDFTTNGKSHRARRIELNSFSTWRLHQRDRDLDTTDHVR